jgi:hypothetical protein
VREACLGCSQSSSNSSSSSSFVCALGILRSLVLLNGTAPLQIYRLGKRAMCVLLGRLWCLHVVAVRGSYCFCARVQILLEARDQNRYGWCCISRVVGMQVRMQQLNAPVVLCTKHAGILHCRASLEASPAGICMCTCRPCHGC